jgi:hypothetical protein
MPKNSPTITLARDERLRDSRRQATSMSLPLAVHHRLDLLADLAVDVNASRAEIIAMLISEADLDVPTLERLVLAYRKKTVGDVVPARAGDGEAENVISLAPRQPGRPPVRSSGAR